MALGPDNFNLTVSLDSIFCFQGDDIDDVFDEESEPYLWVIIIKLDGEGLFQSGNFLVGSPNFFFSPGNHGNIGGSILRGTRRLPPEVGRWETSLKPIPISVAGQQLTSIPGTILCCAVLMEENLTPNSAIEAAHQSLIQLVQTTISNTLASLGLAGLAADAVAEVATEAGRGNTITLAVAANRVLQRRLKPIQDLFTLAAPANTAITILKNLKIDGLIGSAIDADKPMGVFFRALSQAELADTFESAIGLPHGKRIEIGARMFNMPEWAYSLDGHAWAHHKFLRRDLPSSNRLQVTCSSKRPLGNNQKRISGIGGQDGGIFWGLGRAEAAELIRKGQKSFFVVAPDGRSVDVAAVQGGFQAGQPWFFLQTQADQDRGNNLVNLPDCPAGAFTVEVWF
jgi:hypothetical protein